MGACTLWIGHEKYEAIPDIAGGGIGSEPYFGPTSKRYLFALLIKPPGSTTANSKR